MKRLIVIALFLLIALPIHAQIETQFSSGDQFLVRVNTTSLNVHLHPDDASDNVASLFKGDIVQAVSRNLDGSWFEVRRLGRMSNLGWVENDLIDWDFLPETLPLGDISDGVVGPVPLSQPPQYGVYLEQAPILRQLPLRTGPSIMSLPPLIVVPVIARNLDISWLQVNYLGYQGWINIASIRARPDVDWTTLPVPLGMPPPDTVPVVLIPVALQQAQIDRLRAFIADRRTHAVNLEDFWWSVYRGEIMPCNAPAAITAYPFTDDDVRELPELARYVPRLTEAIQDLQDARQPFDNCGVIAPAVAVDARNSAINARVIFDATSGMLDNVEATLHGKPSPATSASDDDQGD